MSFLVQKYHRDPQPVTVELYHRKVQRTWEGVVTRTYWHGSWREGHLGTDSDLGVRDIASLG